MLSFASDLASAAVFNVRDYGAAGDGATKDTAAIRRAVDAGDRVSSLLGRMTLEEKVGQLCERVTQDLSLVNGGDMEGRAFDNEIVQVIRRGEVGTFVGVPGPEAHNLYQKAAVEGVNWFFAPMLDIARDARWGRIAESLGADPVLASRIAPDSDSGRRLSFTLPD